MKNPVDAVAARMSSQRRGFGSWCWNQNHVSAFLFVVLWHQLLPRSMCGRTDVIFAFVASRRGVVAGRDLVADRLESTPQCSALESATACKAKYGTLRFSPFLRMDSPWDKKLIARLFLWYTGLAWCNTGSALVTLYCFGIVLIPMFGMGPSLTTILPTLGALGLDAIARGNDSYTSLIAWVACVRTHATALT